jgi:MFS family permease
MLLGSAFGARLGRRALGDDAADRRALACALVGCAAILVSLALPVVAESLLSAPYAIQIVAGFILCAGLGAFMGVPFPEGVRAATRWRPDSVPFLWGVNGVTSVVGSVLAAILGKTIGSSRVVLTGGVVYLIAALWAAVSTATKVRSDANKDIARPLGWR